MKKNNDSLVNILYKNMTWLTDNNDDNCIDYINSILDLKKCINNKIKMGYVIYDELDEILINLSRLCSKEEMVKIMREKKKINIPNKYDN